MLLVLLLSVAVVMALCGLVLSWVLSFFHVFVPWYACGAGLWLLYFLVRYTRK